MIDLFALENALRQKGYARIAGMDEAGRGPLAGPVAAACVVFEKGVVIQGVNDSKKLTEKTRERLFEEITQNALGWAYAFAYPEVIDELNILGATRSAMQMAFSAVREKTDYLLLDYITGVNIPCPHQAVVKGDQKSFTIAAASIVAKVLRDRYMVQMAQQYPQYGFEKHKGYGTAAHYAALAQYGSCPLHRKSFRLQS